MRLWWRRDFAEGSHAVPAYALRTALAAAGPFAGRQFPFQFDDKSYRAIPRDAFEEMILLFRWDDPEPHPEKFDCDDFVAVFLADLKRGWALRSKCDEALAFGSAWVQLEGSEATHRLIWQYDAEHRVNLYEAQTNKRREETALSAVFEVRA